VPSFNRIVSITRRSSAIISGSRQALSNISRSPHGRLILTVLGGLAEFERELIRARTGEGRAR
jgi:DNA invertase Pin-like site-specific DNA recombinase